MDPVPSALVTGCNFSAVGWLSHGMMVHLEMGGCIPHLETFSQSPVGHFVSKKDAL